MGDERFSMVHCSVRKMADVRDDSEQFPNREYTRLTVKPQGKFAILEKKETIEFTQWSPQHKDTALALIL